MDESIESLKVFLNSIRKQQECVHSLEQSLEQMECEAYSLKSVQLGDKVQSSHTSDLSDVVIKLEGFRTDLHDAYRKLIDLRSAGNALIMHEPDGILQAVLRRRYLLCQRWENIADCMYFSVDHVYRLHRQALADIVPFFKDDSKCQ